MELDPRYASVIVLRYRAEYPDAEIHVLRDGQELSLQDVQKSQNDDEGR